MDQMALTGIRVVDLSGSIATGYCGKLYADYCPEVINLEPEAGFSTRLLAPQIPDHGSAMHDYFNTNKKSVLMAELTEAEIAALIGSAQLVLDSGDFRETKPCEAC
jgi:crotonobetainyl-CoA:carnitine CoA-transferase CaiB-like acyl-CoA transferase